tara:strand:- start:253 stop:450 length:198 start_codon:yes stop_codon:yes gene_type:complete
MSRSRDLIPSPRSKYVSVQCTSCGNEQIIFSAATINIKCTSCDKLLAEKTGGKIKIFANILKRAD